MSRSCHGPAIFSLLETFAQVYKGCARYLTEPGDVEFFLPPARRKIKHIFNFKSLMESVAGKASWGGWACKGLTILRGQHNQPTFRRILGSVRGIIGAWLCDISAENQKQTRDDSKWPVYSTCTGKQYFHRFVVDHGHCIRQSLWSLHFLQVPYHSGISLGHRAACWRGCAFADQPLQHA